MADQSWRHEPKITAPKVIDERIIRAVENKCLLVLCDGDYADTWILPAICKLARQQLKLKDAIRETAVDVLDHSYAKEDSDDVQSSE